MNILQILPKLNTGGVETGTVDLAKKLISAKQKHGINKNTEHKTDNFTDFEYNISVFFLSSQ